MKKFKMTLFILGIIATSFVDANECQKASALKTSKILEKVLSTQNDQIKQVLAGKKVKDFTPQTVFGHGFDVSQTEQKVSQIDKSISERSGIPIEYDSLLVCLEKLKIYKKIEELRALAKENAQLKMSLLRKNQDLGDSLRKADIEENSLPELKEKIGEDTTEALQLKKELEVDLINSTTQSAKEKSAKKREILSFKNELTRLKIQYLEQKLKANKVLEEKIVLFESYSLQLKALSAQIKSNDQKVLIKNFYEVEKVWLTLAKGNYYDLFWSSRKLELAEVPELFSMDENEDESVTIKKQYNDLIALRKEILKNFTDKKAQELKLLNQLVSNSNAIRSSYYETLGYGYFFSSLLKAETYSYFRNEVTTAPYRVFSFFYKKYLFIKEKVSEGKKGYVHLFSHALILILLVISFFSLRTVYGSASKKIDNVFYYFFENFKNTYIVRKVYAIWVKVKDSTVPALWLVTLELLRNISYFSDIELVLRGIEVYLWANIIKSFVTMFLGGVSRLDIGNFQKFKIKAEETSNKFKNIFMFYFFNLLIIEATVGKVYSYTLIYFIVLFYTLYQLVVESSRWEGEFTVYSEKMFAGVIVERFLRFLNFFPAKLRASFLLIFILVFLVFNLLISLTENFELSKKVSANLFKKQIEKIEATDGADTFIPQEYKDLFSPQSLSTTEEYVENGSKLEGKIHAEIKEWIDEKSDEHSLAIYGDKGIGKTTLLKRVESIVGEDQSVDVMYVKLPSKVIEKSALQDFFSSIFNFEAESFDIYRIDSSLPKKTVVILDETQNIFLSKTSGFDAYYALMNIINMNTKNLFWVMSFNKYSWLYLDRAFGRTRFVRNVFEVKGWSDTKIKELIMKRHQNSSYRLSYDLLINATRSQDEIDKYASIESKFFKLLWELSRGNPRSALFLWLSALSRRGQNVFNVNIPKEVEIEGVEKLPDDLLFVIACVLKHENLTSSEIEGTTNLQKGLVRNAVKLGLEKNFFYRDDRARYMIDISTQYGLIKYLRLKNFIYGV